MLYNVITITVVGIALCYMFLIAKRDFLRNPVFYFTVFQLINFLGTIPLLNFNVRVDREYYFVYVIATLSMVIGFVLGDVVFPVSVGRIKYWDKANMILSKGFVYDKLVWGLVWFSAIVSILYFIAVGYNVFLLGIASMISGGGVVKDVSRLRMASYNSDITGNYYYPGYVNQFKDTLLPLLLFYLWVKNSRVKGKKVISKFFLIVVSILAVVLILGTGQRGAFVLAGLQGGAFMVVVASAKNKKKIVIGGGLFVMMFMILSTFMIGRTKSGTFDLGESLGAIWWRIASANQFGAVVGFREIIYQEPSQWGREFSQSVVGLLPGVKGSMLSNRIAKKIWGGYGTAPPSNWGALYYDFYWYGVVLFPILFSIFLKYLYYRFYSKEKSLFRVLIYMSSFVILGTWLAGNPVNYYFNVGLLAVIFLRFLYSRMGAIFGQKRIAIPMSLG